MDVSCNICEDDCGQECDEENGDGVKCKEEEERGMMNVNTDSLDT